MVRWQTGNLDYSLKDFIVDCSSKPLGFEVTNMKVLVSACIMGENRKYNGKNDKNSAAIHFLKDKEVISICPEV